MRAEPPIVSIVIPTLNASLSIERTLRSIGKPATSGICEVLVVDGSSDDRTVVIAREAGATVVVAPRGRGSQLAAGALAASGGWLLFLHADTLLPAEWPQLVLRFAGAPANRERAAVFGLRFAATAQAARRLEKLVDWRSRSLGLPYGDQGLLISADFYRALGGFKALPLMEDVDLVRRIGRRRLAVLEGSVETSALRYRSSFLTRSTRNLACLALYFLGVPPRLLVRLYG